MGFFRPRQDYQDPSPGYGYCAGCHADRDIDTLATPCDSGVCLCEYHKQLRDKMKRQYQ